MYMQESVAVFTTPERCDLFRSAVGDGADFRLDPYESLPLGVTLANLRVGGCSVVVLDECHFFDIRQLADGLKMYMNDPANRHRLLRMIIVCSSRYAGDEWLDFFAGYLGVYDIVFAAEGTEVIRKLSELLVSPNDRTDVAALLIDRRLHEDEAKDDAEAEACCTVPVSCECTEGNVTVHIGIDVHLGKGNTF